MNLNYSILLVFCFLALVLSTIIALTSVFLTEKLPSEEKVSCYECGFDPIHLPGQPFSIKFFLVGILFLIFDLEIVYLFPWSTVSSIIDINGQIVIVLFLILLVLGLIFEWIKGGLEWE